MIVVRSVGPSSLYSVVNFGYIWIISDEWPLSLSVLDKGLTLPCLAQKYQVCGTRFLRCRQMLQYRTCFHLRIRNGSISLLSLPLFFICQLPLDGLMNI